MRELRIPIRPGEIIVKHPEAHDGVRIGKTRYRRTTSFWVNGKLVSIITCFSSNGKDYPSVL